MASPLGLLFILEQKRNSLCVETYILDDKEDSRKGVKDDVCRKLICLSDSSRYSDGIISGWDHWNCIGAAFFSGGLLALAGVAGFALYFLGFYLAGFAGFGDLAVFGIGLILLILELVVPSFGILSVLGAICLFGGVLMASSDPTQAAIMLGIALLLAIVAISFAIKTFKHRGIWNRFILKEQLTTNKGFTSSPDRSYLIGMTGRSDYSAAPGRHCNHSW